MLFVACVAALMAAAAAQCDGVANTLPIWDGTPQFVTSVPNGTLYVAKAQMFNELNVAHYYGTPYQMGYAQGLLFKDKITEMVPRFIQYMDSQIEVYLQWLPKFLQDIVATDGIEAALALTAELTAPYTPAHFTEELQGLADALNGSVSYQRMLNLQMFPELIKASCTMIGAWGPAIETCSNLRLTQLRALDFGTDSPLVSYPVLAVYHPLAGNGHPFATLGWTGFIGSVTAYSGIMGVSEKVWDAYKGKKSSEGIPFHYLLRDIAQYDLTVDDSFNRIYNASRTCSIWIGLGSNYTSQFRAVAYSLQEVITYDDLNFPTWSVHPYLEGAVYIDKHVQPSYDPCLGSKMVEYYGQLNGETIIRNIVGPFQTGDLHAAVYEFAPNTMYVSVAGVPINQNGLPVLNGTVASAYERPWFQFNMNTLFSQQASE